MNQTTPMTTPLLFSQVEDIAKCNSEKLLTSLGLEVDNYGNCRCSCPVHGGDNPSGFSYDSQSNTWKCWTHKCHEEYASSLIGLVRGIKQYSFAEAMQYIVEICGSESKEPHVLELQRYIKSQMRKEKKGNYALDKTFIEQFPIMDFGIPDRNISPSTAFAYSIRSSKGFNHALKNRILFPIYNDKKELMGISGRSIEENGPKWYHYPATLRIGELLWPINQSISTLQETATAILVEGPFDAVICHQYGYYNVLCVFGTNVTNDQVKLLLKYGVRKVKIFFDPDEAGMKAAEKISNKLQLYFNVEVLSGYDKDPSEMTREELDKLLMEKCHD